MLWELDWTMLPPRLLSNSRTLILCLQGPGNSVVALCWCLPALPLLLPSVSLCHVCIWKLIYCGKGLMGLLAGYAQ